MTAPHRIRLSRAKGWRIPENTVNVACWCALDGKPCHGDVLLEVANREPRP